VTDKLGGFGTGTVTGYNSVYVMPVNIIVITLIGIKDSVQTSRINRADNGNKQEDV
jgi:hypothetical protein